MYMPQDGHWLASFEVIPPIKNVGFSAAEKIQKTAKFWIRNSSFQWGMFIFLAAEKLTFGGGITSKLAS